LTFPTDQSGTPKGLRMGLKLELEINTRTKSPLMELVSIKEDVGALLNLSRHGTCFRYFLLESHNFSLKKAKGLPFRVRTHPMPTLQESLSTSKIFSK